MHRHGHRVPEAVPPCLEALRRVRPPARSGRRGGANASMSDPDEDETQIGEDDRCTRRGRNGWVLRCRR